MRARTLVTRNALRASGTTTPVRFSSRLAQRSNSLSSMPGMGESGENFPVAITMLDIHPRQTLIMPQSLAPRLCPPARVLHPRTHIDAGRQAQSGLPPPVPSAFASSRQLEVGDRTPQVGGELRQVADRLGGLAGADRGLRGDFLNHVHRRSEEHTSELQS